MLGDVLGVAVLVIMVAACAVLCYFWTGFVDGEVEAVNDQQSGMCTKTVSLLIPYGAITCLLAGVVWPILKLLTLQVITPLWPLLCFCAACVLIGIDLAYLRFANRRRFH